MELCSLVDSTIWVWVHEDKLAAGSGSLAGLIHAEGGGLQALRIPFYVRLLNNNQIILTSTYSQEQTVLQEISKVHHKLSTFYRVLFNKVICCGLLNLGLST